MNEYVVLALGIVCAGIGGELFVRGTVGLASLVRISPGIVGATVAALRHLAPNCRCLSALHWQKNRKSR